MAEPATPILCVMNPAVEATRKMRSSEESSIRIMAGANRRACCRELFKKFNVLSLASEFLLSLLSSVVDNMEKFQINSDIHSISTRYRYNLHVLNTNLSKYQKGCEISSSHGGEYDVQSCLLGCTAGRQSFYTAVQPRRQL
jgi:hypothetical protein